MYWSPIPPFSWTQSIYLSSTVYQVSLPLPLPPICNILNLILSYCLRKSMNPPYSSVSCIRNLSSILCTTYLKLSVFLYFSNKGERYSRFHIVIKLMCIENDKFLTGILPFFSYPILKQLLQTMSLSTCKYGRHFLTSPVSQRLVLYLGFWNYFC